MNSEEVMTRYRMQLILAAERGCLTVVDTDRPAEHDNVVSFEAERTKRAAAAWRRSQGLF